MAAKKPAKKAAKKAAKKPAKKAAKKAAKKPAKKAAKKPAKKKVARKPNAAFMRPVTVSVLGWVQSVGISRRKNTWYRDARAIATS